MSTAASTVDNTARAIQALEAAFEQHGNARDAAVLTESFYAEDAQLLPPNAPRVKGKTAIRDFWTAFIAAGAAEMKLETGEVAQSGDLAYSIGAYGYTLEGVRHSGKYLVVYRRDAAGAYKAIADAFNDNQ